MIYELTNRDVWPSKRNFVDQNNVVFGYDDQRDCCESFGMGVYDPATHELVAECAAKLDPFLCRLEDDRCDSRG